MSNLWNNHNEFMGAWAHDDADKDIKALIEEHNQFKLCTDFEYEKEVNDVFDSLVNTATRVAVEQVGAASASITADGLALAAVFDFGMSMAPFLIAEAAAIALTITAASEQGDLTKAMKSADVDIADKIGKDSNVATWIKKYKTNNDMIVNYCGKDLPTKEARRILFDFIAAIEVSGEELTVESFRKHAKLCKILWDSDTKDKVSDALDNLNFSNKTPQDIADCLNALQKYSIAYFATEILKVSFLVTAVKYMATYFKLPYHVMTDAYELVAKESPRQLLTKRLFEEGCSRGRLVRTGSAKFLAGIDVIISVVDLFFQVYAIVEAVEQAKAIESILKYKMQPKYIEYFGNIKDGAREYNNTVVDRKHDVMDTINDDTEA